MITSEELPLENCAFIFILFGRVSCYSHSLMEHLKRELIICIRGRNPMVGTQTLCRCDSL